MLTLEIVDDELERFCQLNDADPTNIAKTIERYVTAAEDDDFIPIFLKTMNEEHFFEQMCACALESSREEAVREAPATRPRTRGQRRKSGPPRGRGGLEAGAGAPAAID